MKGKHAKPLAVPKRVKIKNLNQEQVYHQVFYEEDELLQQELEVQEFEELQLNNQLHKKSLFSRLIENVKQLTKKQITAFSTLLIMLIQMFSPYTVLLSTVQAAVNPATDKLVLVKASEPKTSSSGNKVIQVDYIIIGENVGGIAGAKLY